MDWKESDEAHRIAIGWDIPAISNIRIHGEPYRIASQGTWTYDEDHRLVLKLKIVFQETPFTRFLRFYLKDSHLLLRCSELPGESFLYSSFALLLEPFEHHPILGSALDRMHIDYLDYRIQRVFSPKIHLHRW